MGVEILQFLEGQEKIQAQEDKAAERIDRIKIGLLANPDFDSYKLFPTEFGGDTEVPDETFFDPNMAWDYSDVRWEVPSVDEWEKIQQEINQSVSVPLQTPEEQPITFADGTVFEFDRLTVPDMQDVPKFDLSGIPDAPSQEVTDNGREWL